MESNLLLPYKYHQEEGKLRYKFTTISGAEYTAYFIEQNYFETCLMYELSFEKEGGGKIYDKRVSHTIISIAKEFFRKNSSSLIFICDNTDNRHKSRSILFNRWFNTHPDSGFLKYNIVLESIAASIIVEKDNPLKEMILSEFKGLIKYIDY